MRRSDAIGALLLRAVAVRKPLRRRQREIRHVLPRSAEHEPSGLAPRLPITITLLIAIDYYLRSRLLRPLPVIGQGVLRFAFIPAQFFSARPLHLEQEGRAQISRCASGAGGRTCQSEAARKGWRGVLAQRTPPMRAAAKRRSQAELGRGVGPRRGVYGALAGRLTAERRAKVGVGRPWSKN